MTLRPFTVLVAFILACGGGSAKEAPPSDAGASPAGGSELSAFETENGVGPLKSAVTVGALDKDMAERGEKDFETRCSGCHKMDERYVGPPLRDVTTRRTPTYVMNMILAPDSMYGRHPTARALLAEFATQMPNLHLTESEARDILEYLREKAQDHD